MKSLKKFTFSITVFLLVFMYNSHSIATKFDLKDKNFTKLENISKNLLKNDQLDIEDIEKDIEYIKTQDKNQLNKEIYTFNQKIRSVKPDIYKLNENCNIKYYNHNKSRIIQLNQLKILNRERYMNNEKLSTRGLVSTLDNHSFKYTYDIKKPIKSKIRALLQEENLIEHIFINDKNYNVPKNLAQKDFIIFFSPYAGQDFRAMYINAKTPFVYMAADFRHFIDFENASIIYNDQSEVLLHELGHLFSDMQMAGTKYKNNTEWNNFLEIVDMSFDHEHDYAELIAETFRYTVQCNSNIEHPNSIKTTLINNEVLNDNTIKKLINFIY